MFPKKNESKEVVVVLPYSRNKVLMQLRDFNTNIIFPASWAFFGGAINDGETPEGAAKRELFEEIGYKPQAMYKLSMDHDFGSILIHSFYCPLTTGIDKLMLNEGLDMAFLSLEEVLSGKFYSERMKRLFPVADSPYMSYIIKKLQQRFKSCEE